MPFTAAVLAVILTYVWVVEPRAPRSLVVIPGTIVLALGCWRSLRTGEWGLSPGAFWPGLRAALFFTAPIVLVILGLGAARGTLQRDRGDMLSTLAGLIIWGAAQQWLLQTVVLRESQRTASRKLGIVLAALLFAAIHLPNPFLAAMTLLGGLGWAAIYDRHPNILPLALSHAIGTLAILYAFDDGVTGRLRIGPAYLSLID